MDTQEVVRDGFQYEAFISYRHVSPDNKIAKALQNKIENYKIPACIRKLTGRRRMGKFFRDRDELPTSADLGADITAALESSRWLIVVCSPELPRSKWCMKEIDAFIALGRRDRILTLLISGEPEQSFPPQLRFAADDGGAVTELEPLAADVRSKSAGRMKRKLGTEMLRLLAPMLGVGFDDLRRRSRERAIKRALGVSVAAAVLLAAFGVYAANQALTIARQNDAISRQNDEITRANEVLEIQIGQTQLSQSKFLTSLAKEEYEKGNELGAVQLALAALPENFDAPERPVYNDAVAMLRSIELKDNYSAYKSAFIIYNTNDRGVLGTDSAISPDGQYIGIRDPSGIVSFYSAVNGEKIGPGGADIFYINTSMAKFAFYPDGEKVLSGTGKVADFKDGKIGTVRDLGTSWVTTLSGDGRVLVCDRAGENDEYGYRKNTLLAILDPETFEVRASKIIGMQDILQILLTYDGSLAACRTGRTIKVVRTEDLSEVFSAALNPDVSSNLYNLALSPDGKYLAAQQQLEAVQDEDTGVYQTDYETVVYDLKTKDKVLSVTSTDKTAAAFSPDSGSFVLGMADNTVKIYDTGAFKPVKVLTGHSGAVTGIVFSPDGSVMVTSGTDNRAIIWNAADFSFLDQDIGENRIDVISISSDNGTIVINCDGDIKVLKKAQSPLVTELNCKSAALNQVGDILFGFSDGGGFVAYDRDTMREMLEFGKAEYAFASPGIALSPDKRRAFVSDYSTFSIWDMTSGRKLTGGESPMVALTSNGVTIDMPTSLKTIGYSKDGKTVYCYVQRGTLTYLATFDSGTGELRKMTSLGNSPLMVFDPLKSVFLLKKDETIEIFDTENFDSLVRIDIDRGDMWFRGLYLSPGADVVLCYLENIAGGAGARIKAYDVKTGGLLYQVDSKNEFGGLSFMRDGKSLVIQDGSLLKQMDLYTGGTVRVLLDPTETDLLYDCDEIILSPNEKLIACRKYAMSTIEVWDIETGGIVARIEIPSFGTFGSMQFVKRGTALVISAERHENKYSARYYELRDDKTVAESARKNLLRELTKQERKRYFID